MSDFKDLDERLKFVVYEGLPVNECLGTCEMCGRFDLGHIQFKWRNVRGALCRSCVRWMEGLGWSQLRTIGR